MISISAVKVITVTGDRLEVVDDGRLWSGVVCRTVESVVIVDGGDEMANKVRAWIIAGNVPEPYIGG